MHAVLGTWTVDEGLREERQRELHDAVIPLTRVQPGFVSGYWMDDPETGRAHTMIVFDGEAPAAAFKALVESRLSQAAQVGVTSDILALVEVSAAARSEASP